MIFDTQGNTTIITRESVSLGTFLERFKKSYKKLKNDNLIIDLFSLEAFDAEELLSFLEFSTRHRKQKRSFIIVTGKISHDDIPEELVVVPTLQEAKDIIEMEEIERDLGF